MAQQQSWEMARRQAFYPPQQQGCSNNQFSPPFQNNQIVQRQTAGYSNNTQVSTYQNAQSQEPLSFKVEGPRAKFKFSGPAGTYESFFACHLALTVATGKK